MSSELAAIVKETQRHLTSYDLKADGVTDGDSAEVLGSSRGRRILLGLNGDEHAMMIFSFAEKLCTALEDSRVRQAVDQKTEVDLNAVLLEFCTSVNAKARAKSGSTSAKHSATPPVLVRSSVAVITAPQARCETALITTPKGTLGITAIVSEPPVDTPESAGKQRVLIVDDDPFARKLLAKALRDMGLEVETAKCGKEAMVWLDTSTADLVMLDYNMPGMDGEECLQRIKQKHPQIPVVMVTAMGTMRVVKACLARGASGFVVKPYQIPDVRKYVSKVLSKEPVLSS